MIYIFYGCSWLCIGFIIYYIKSKKIGSLLLSRQKTVSDSKTLPRKTILLFLIYTDKRNVIFLEAVKQNWPDYQIIIVYQGPDWKVHALKKYDNFQFTVLKDEKGQISQLLGIVNFPTCISYHPLFRNAGLVKDHSIHIFKE
ncbi:hypothetical protein [Paenibacillus alba]|uniref:Uncharacterized protein n=1 Tax=Paenibacillus alba TaxID=1197127 RepID=A0ABU6GBR7_9BACL|nr:hypothetical protein [Paenibacillus alba]MEC0231596.1 hypothetical protein [Paenibacillus alba]NQX69766.1 hypothetical protein [Paenibacillus alba]